MKQFLMICDEEGVAAISRVCGTVVKFIEVQGTNSQDGKYNVLVSPIPQSGEPNGQQPAEDAILPATRSVEAAVCDSCKD
jgi:hypothetical protein